MGRGWSILGVVATSSPDKQTKKYIFERGMRFFFYIIDTEERKEYKPKNAEG
jgi:hypothetical protein